MDIDELPIGERLDALLRQFDDSSRDPEGDLDYAQFVERRAQEHERNDTESDAEQRGSASVGLDTAFDSEAENHWFSGNESEEEPLLSPLSSPGEPQSLAKPTVSPKKPKKSKKKTTRNRKESTQPLTNPSQASQNIDRPVDKHVAEVYSEAGIDLSNSGFPRNERNRKRTVKQTQRELEEAACQNQRLERMLTDDIGCHTAKTVTVDDFLVDFDGLRDSPESSPAKPRSADKRFSELVSSPPRMQGLRSFVAHGDSHKHSDPISPAPSHGDADSDSDLEIIPETRAARMPQPIRELLRLGGGTTADHQLAASRARLQQMERDQIVNRSRTRMEKLKAQGFDVDGLMNALNEQRQASAQGAAAWLARERAEADALLAIERSDEGENGSENESDASSSDIEIEGIDTSENQNVASSGVRHGRNFVLSDSEEDSDSEAKPQKAPEADRKLSERGSVNQTGAEPETDTDEDEEGGQFTGGTQYVAPLSPRARAALFGSQVGDVEPTADAPASVATSTFADTPPDTVPDGDLEIEVGRDAGEESRVEPDLADLRNADLSLSQRMAEVRQRYLRAEHEQRRQLIQQKQAKPVRKLARSAFVEDQAEESDDEEAVGGLRRDKDAGDEEDDNDDEDTGDADLAELVDHADVDVRAAKLKQKFVEEERKRDERLLNHFVDGVNGGFRRRQARDANGVFLSDDDMEFDNNEEIRAYRQMLEKKRQSKLLGSNSRVARLAANERNHAFFQSITTELIVRPTGAERSSTVQDGLQFLRSVADSSHRQPSVPAPEKTAGANAHGISEHSDTESAPTGLSSALKLASVRNSKEPRRPSRQSTHQDPFSSGPSGRRTTYASRISAPEVPSGKTVEILQSLGPAQPQRPKKKFAVGPVAPAQKRRHMVSTTAHESGSVLFRRNWT